MFQLKEEMKFRYNYPLVRLCLTKRITNQQIGHNSLKSSKKESNITLLLQDLRHLLNLIKV